MVMKIIQEGDRPERKLRRPTFPLGGVMKPFGLYPLMCAYVAPGETLQSYSVKWRVVSKPVTNPLVGAWLQSWLVYVKLTDMDEGLTAQFISDAEPTTGYTLGADKERYFSGSGQINWIRQATLKFHEDYFMDEGETRKTIDDDIAQVKLNNKSWMQNLMFRPDESALDTSDPWDAEEQMRAFRLQQMLDMQALTYEQYLAQFGVEDLSGVDRRPEILQYWPSWTTPVNTIDPASGAPSSAWLWGDELQMSKPKRFKEPGFLMLFATVRPKMAHKYQKWSTVGNMWGISDFFPIHEQMDPAANVKKILTDDVIFDPLANASEASDELWYDRADVLEHGEQFFNVQAGGSEWPYEPYWATAPNLLAASTKQEMRGEYCSEADINSIFVGASASDRFVFYDGLGSARISGHTKSHFN